MFEWLQINYADPRKGHLSKISPQIEKNLQTPRGAPSVNLTVPSMDRPLISISLVLYGLVL